MEFIRYGARTGGRRIGCCAIDLLQGFDVDPDSEMLCPAKYGDTGDPILENGMQAYFGPTALDIFKQRLKVGTFDRSPMPSRMFIAAIAGKQLHATNTRKWLRILKEHGFRWMTSADNSVYGEGSIVHVFVLIRDISNRTTPFAPDAWTEIDAEPIEWNEETWCKYEDEVRTFCNPTEEQIKNYEQIGSSMVW